MRYTQKSSQQTTKQFHHVNHFVYSFITVIVIPTNRHDHNRFKALCQNQGSHSFTCHPKKESMGLIGAHILQPDYLPVTQSQITEVNLKHWCQSLKITQSTSSFTDPPRASVWYQLRTTRINDQKQITIRRVTQWRNFLMSYIYMPAVFCHYMGQALQNVCYCDLWHHFFIRYWLYGHFLKPTDSIIFE